MKRSLVLSAASLMLVVVAFFRRPSRNARAPETRPRTRPLARRPRPRPPPSRPSMRRRHRLHEEADRHAPLHDAAAARLPRKYQREYFSLPYQRGRRPLARHEARRTTTGTVVSHIPCLTARTCCGLLMREKQRFLILQYDDPDTDYRLTSFKLENGDGRLRAPHARRQGGTQAARRGIHPRQGKDAPRRRKSRRRVRPASFRAGGRGEIKTRKARVRSPAPSAFLFCAPRCAPRSFALTAQSR